MSDKEVTMEDLDESMKQTDEQLNLMTWKNEGTGKEVAVPIDNQAICVINLLRSVSETQACGNLSRGSHVKLTLTHAQVRTDYQNLKKELLEVQALQRELSTRLRAQLLHVHDKFTRLRQKLAASTPR